MSTKESAAFAATAAIDGPGAGLIVGVGVDGAGDGTRMAVDVGAGAAVGVVELPGTGVAEATPACGVAVAVGELSRAIGAADAAATDGATLLPPPPPPQPTIVVAISTDQKPAMECSLTTKSISPAYATHS
jgi:hypothetical protein